MSGPIASQGAFSKAVGNPVAISGGVVGLLQPTLDTPFGPLAVPAAVKDKWDSLTTQTDSAGGSVQAYLGWPLRRLDFGGGGTAVYFERGMIVLRPDGGCYVVYGAIYLRYAALGDVQPTGWSPGLPISDEEAVANGRRSRFDGADIYWSPATDGHEVHGAIRDHWQALGGADGFLGYPLTDETLVLDTGTEIGRMNLFQGGSIYWSPASGAWEVHGDLRRAWLERYGGPTGALGWPVSDETSSPSGSLRYNDFANGCLAWPGNYADIRMLTGVDVYLDRLDSKGAHTFWERQGTAGVWLYSNASVSTSTSGSASQRFPGSGHYGANASPQTALLTVNPLRGSTTIDVSFDGSDAVAVGNDVHLGTVTGHFDLDSIFNNPGPQEIWSGDFFAAYSIRNLTPADPMDPSFRQDLFWGFANFKTATLSKEQFGQTFTDVQGDESGWHPFDDLFYNNVYKGIAAGGNCFGMCLEANDALARKSLYSESIHGVANSAIADNEMNLKQGYQVGASVIDYVVGKFLTGGTHDPVRCFNESRDMYGRNDYPIISLTNAFIGGSGHAVRPYRWDQSNPNDWVIYVANPNEPAPGGSDDDGQNTIHVDPNANRFTFAFQPSDVWSGDAWTGGRMFALPFSVMCEEQRTPFWETLLALIGGSILILAGDATTQQLSDGQGRTFYTTPAGVTPTRWDQVNEAATDRIPGLARISLHHELPLGPLNRQVVPVGSGAKVSQVMNQVGSDTAIIGTVIAALGPAVPEVYRLQGIRPFGASPAESHFSSIGVAAESAAVSASLIAAESPAAGSLQLGGATNVLQTAGAAALSTEVAATSSSITRSGPVDQLTHEVTPGSGAYTWAIRSAGTSAAAAVPGGAQTADVLSLSKPGAVEQALSVTLGTSPQPRAVSLTLVNSGSAGPSQFRVFTLSNVALKAGEAFTASLTSDGSQIVLENAGSPVTLALEIRAGLGPQAMVSRPSVTLEAGKAAIIQPDSWDPAQIATSPVSMSVLDKVGGAVLQQLKIQ